MNTITLLNEYQKLAMRTAKAMPTYQDDLHHAALGIAGEAGEFADAVKKFTIYSKDLNVANAIEELGDLLWYIALAANSLETSLEDIATANIVKLKVRYPEKYTDQLAVARLDKAVVAGTDTETVINWQNLLENAIGVKTAPLTVTLDNKARPIPIYDVMIDIETLGLCDAAVILQIGAVGQFKDTKQFGIIREDFCRTLDEDLQPTRTKQTSTLEWWGQQDPTTAMSVMSGVYSLPAALESLNAWIYSLPVPTTMCRFLAKGNLDFRVLEHAYKEAGIEVPWKYWQLVDLRSLQAAFPQVTPTTPDVPHDALSDAYAQMTTLEEINVLVALVTAINSVGESNNVPST